MRKIQCPNDKCNLFFDADKFSTCPFCGEKTKIDSPEENAPNPSGELPPTCSLFRPTEDIHQGKDNELTPKYEMEKKDISNEQQPNGGDFLKKAVDSTNSTIDSPLPNTIAYFGAEEIDPPVAWLVCIKGAYLGCAFECRAGRNKIGRGFEMDINLEKDLKVTREVNALLVYEPIKKLFFIQAGLGNGLVYCNDEIVMTFTSLKAHDHIMVGDSEFVFIPLCGERFSWENYIREDKLE